MNKLHKVEKRLEAAENYFGGYLPHVLVNNALGGNMVKVTFEQFLYCRGLDELISEGTEFIPRMVDPLGKHWQQPLSDLISIYEKVAIMDKNVFGALSEYSTSLPSGVYVGKMWKRRGEPGVWYLCWYGHHPAPDTCSVNYREIQIHQSNYLYMYDQQRTLIIKEQVDDFEYYVNLQKQQIQQINQQKNNGKK